MIVKQGFNKLKQIIHRIMSAQSEPNLDLDYEMLKQMVLHILSTRPDEIGCDACLEQLDHFVDMTLAGKNASQAMPLVQDHLERCTDCREEFEALLAALRAMA
jgi:hypothetical protein